MTQNLTTVFIGNITENCSNELIQRLLKLCGSVNSWKRLQDTDGKYQAFGFCEFLNPDGTIRALRVLNKFQLGEKILTVKTDEATSKLLAERKLLITATEEHANESAQLFSEIIAAIKEDNPRLLEMMNSNKDKGDSKNRKNFDREASHCLSRSRSRSQRCGESNNGRSRSSRQRSLSRSRRSRSITGSRRRSTKRRHSSDSSSSASMWSSTSHASSHDHRSDSHRRRSGGGHHRKRRSSTADRSLTEDADDMEERRRLKEEIKRKEHSYMKRLEKWEEREHRMAKQYQRDEQNEIDRRKMIQREAKKLRQFLEDYDDERDDLKYYRSTFLIQRRRNYERERELDIRDRQEELQEIEELKRQIVAERTNVDDLDAEAARLYEAKNNKKLKSLRAHSGSPTPHRPLGQPADGGLLTAEQQSCSTTPDKPISPSLSEQNGDGDNEDEMHVDDGGSAHDSIEFSERPSDGNDISAPATTSSSNSTVGGGCGKIKLQKPVLARVNAGIFGDDDDEDEQQLKKKIKPFEITREDRIQAMTPEERKKLIKELIERIPTTLEPLFAFNVSWAHVDEPLVERRIRPWINRKICEYIGEEEKSLVAFICEKIAARTEPKKILADLAMVLDDEAEVFMIKLWRLIIYESEANKLGLPILSSSSTRSSTTATQE